MDTREVLKHATIDAYRVLGIPDSYAATQERRKLYEMLDIAEPKFADLACELSPTSFDPSDPELRAFPRPLKWRWDSAERALRNFDGRGMMTRLPLFWQVEPALFVAGQAAGAFIFVNDRDNMPLGAAAIRDANIHTVVTDADDAAVFSAFLTEHNAPSPEAWVVVHRPDGEWTLPPAVLGLGPHLAQEVHLFPGVVVLEQCEKLMEAKVPRFHATEGYVIETEGDASFIYGRAADPLPLFKYELGFGLNERGVCPCGKPILER